MILTKLAATVRGETAVIVAPDLPKLFPKPASMEATSEQGDRVSYRGGGTSWQSEYNGSTVLIRASWPRDLGPMTDLLGDKAVATGNQYVYEYTYENMQAFAPAREHLVNLFHRISRS